MFLIKIHHSVLVLLLGKTSLFITRTFPSSYSFSLGLAYAGTNREDVIEMISNALREGTPSMEV